MTDIAEKRINKMTKEEKEAPQDISLTEKQRELLLKAWKEAPHDKPPTLKELVNIAFPDVEFDGRNREGKIIKDFLSTFSLFPASSEWKKIGPYSLSVAEKDFIQSNYDKNLDNKMEMIKLLFPDKKLSPLSKEFKAVHAFIKELHFTPGTDTSQEAEESKSLFNPPKNYTECLRLINKYTHDIISIQDASEREKNGVNVLIRYLHSPRFMYMVNTYSNEANRTLFLSEFIRATFDKPDLTVDELNLYLNLCSDYVSGSQVKREIELLSKRLNDIVEDADAKMSTSLADTISAKNKEYNDCLERQEKLVNKLNGSRAIRLKNQATANSSIKSLVDYWIEEKNRKKFLHLAKIKEKARIETTISLNSMESVKAEIFGAVKESFD